MISATITEPEIAGVDQVVTSYRQDAFFDEALTTPVESHRGRLLVDRKADIAKEEIFVRRSNTPDCLLSLT